MRVPARSFLMVSTIPLLQMGALYTFALAATIELGHYPSCSINDPKSIGLEPFYYLVILLSLITCYSVPGWLILLVLQLYRKLPWKKPLVLFCTGWTLILVQFFLDPFRTLCWLMD